MSASMECSFHYAFAYMIDVDLVSAKCAPFLLLGSNCSKTTAFAYGNQIAYITKANAKNELNKIFRCFSFKFMLASLAAGFFAHSIRFVQEEKKSTHINIVHKKCVPNEIVCLCYFCFTRPSVFHALMIID